MVDSRISKRYATSFIEAMIEKKLFDVVSSDFQLLISAADSSRELQHLIKSPIIKPQTKVSILLEIFGNKINKETAKFIKFLSVKGRENLLIDIAKNIIDLRDEKLGIVEVGVNTAFELSEDQKEKLKNNLEKYLDKKVRFIFSVNDELVGGFIAKAGDTVYDASVKHQLENLKKQFMRGGASLN